MSTVSRNAPCPCGSGKKYKHCHLGKTDVEASSPRFVLPVVLAVLAIAAGVYIGLDAGIAAGFSVAIGGLIAIGLYVLLRDPPPPGKGGDPGAINFGR